MVASLLESGLKGLVERDVDLLPLLQRAWSRSPEPAIQAGEATTLLAAAECVAAAAGRPPQDPPALLVRWLESHPGGPSLALMAAAIKAVDRMKSDGAAPDELLDDLRARLHGAAR